MRDRRAAETPRPRRRAARGLVAAAQGLADPRPPRPHARRARSIWSPGAGNLVAFVEVKTRATAAELDFAIDEHRLRRVAAAAEVLMPRYAGPGDDIRIDVILLAPRHARLAISRTPGSGDLVE